MCYNALQLKRRIYKDAVRQGASQEELDELEAEIRKLEEQDDGEYGNHYHLAGFNHPKLFAYDRYEQKLKFRAHIWGLIPPWTKNEEDAKKFWNNTLNARGETIFDKPSFRDAAKSKRCIIPLDGFYEFKHLGGQTYPHLIRSITEDPLMVGGLVSDWLNKETGEILSTVSIVTTRGNEMMTRIHNPPGKESRMPLILEDQDLDTWMLGNKDEVQALIKPNTNIELKAHTVRRLSGKEYIGDVEKITEEYVYDELNEPPSLF